MRCRGRTSKPVPLSHLGNVTIRFVPSIELFAARGLQSMTTGITTTTVPFSSVNQLLQLCTVRTVWSDAETRPVTQSTNLL